MMTDDGDLPPRRPQQPVAFTTTARTAETPERSAGPVMWFLAVVGAIALVAIAGVVVFLLVDDGSSSDADDGDAIATADDDVDPVVAESPPESAPPAEAEADDAGAAAAAEAESSDDGSSSDADDTTTTTEAGEDEAAVPAPDPGDDVAADEEAADGGDDSDLDGSIADTPTGEVAESMAVVRNGQIYLEGAVPDEESAAELEALAAEILGPENVFNNYVIDPRAGDPSLGNITVEDTINFEKESAQILPEAEPLLNQGLALLTIRPAMTITIVGHTDADGDAEGNLRLSQRRADAVKQWWVDRGVEPARLEAVGAGEAFPIADNITEEGKRLNRRIQFFLENILGDA